MLIKLILLCVKLHKVTLSGASLHGICSHYINSIWSKSSIIKSQFLKDVGHKKSITQITKWNFTQD